MIKSILKGIVIGIANIIPGVSGGTMAVTMGIYDKLIHSVTHIHKEFKKSVKFLYPLAIGMVIGLVGLSFIIKMAFEQYPVQTNFMFIGLIVGGLPIIWGRLKGTGKKITVGNIVSFVIFFALVVGMAIVGDKEGMTNNIEPNMIEVIKLFLIGAIVAATMVIPGVSGSMVLVLLGYYQTILNNITGLISSLLKLDIPVILAHMIILVPFGIGVLVGIVAIAKFIEFVFDKYPNYAFCGILGLVLASPIGIVLISDMSKYNVVSVLTGLVAAVVGVIIALKLGVE